MAQVLRSVRWKRRTRWLALVLALTLLAAACGNSGDDSDGATDTTSPSEDSTGDTTGPATDTTAAPGDGETMFPDTFVPVDAPGVTDTEIKVGTITATTNPIGGKYGDIAVGVQAYFDYVNAQGGIYGRELRVSSERDDQLANNVTEVEALLAQDDVFAAFIATILFTGADALGEAGIPTYGWNIQTEWSGKENFFPNSGALCVGCPGRFLSWLAREIGAETVAVVGYGTAEQSKVCAEASRDGFELYSDAVGGTEVGFYDDSLEFGQVDFSAQVAAMKDAGVEFVTTCMDLNGVFGLANEMVKQDLDATFYHPNMYDHEFIEANGELFDGDYVLAAFRAFEHEPKIEAIQTFLDWQAEQGFEMNELVVQGWIAAKQLVDQLVAAGPDFSQEAVVAAGNTFTDYTADGWLAPIDWTKQHEDPKDNPEAQADLSCSNLVQVSDDAFTSAFSDGELIWICFDNSVPTGEWVEPELMTFE